MPRYIDADALESKQKTIYMEFENVAVPTRVISIADLHLAPTIDAVEVVRCRDCMHYQDGACGQIAYVMDGYYRDTFERKQPDDFCSRGERMDAEVEG